MMLIAHCLKGAGLVTGITEFGGVGDLVCFSHVAHFLNVSWLLWDRDDHQILRRRNLVRFCALVYKISQLYCMIDKGLGDGDLGYKICVLQ